MSVPIDSDWSKAGALAGYIRLRENVTYEDAVTAIAQALAEERERARAPFLAWAAEVEEVVGILRRAAATEGKDYDRKRYTEMADESQAVIDRIHTAAEEGQ